MGEKPWPYWNTSEQFNVRMLNDWTRCNVRGYLYHAKTSVLCRIASNKDMYVVFCLRKQHCRCCSYMKNSLQLPESILNNSYLRNCCRDDSFLNVHNHIVQAYVWTWTHSHNARVYWWDRTCTKVLTPHWTQTRVLLTAHQMHTKLLLTALPIVKLWVPSLEKYIYSSTWRKFYDFQSFLITLHYLNGYRTPSPVTILFSVKNSTASIQVLYST